MGTLRYLKTRFWVKPEIKAVNRLQGHVLKMGFGILCGLVFMACSDRDDHLNTKQVIGAWELVEQGYFEKGKAIMQPVTVPRHIEFYDTGILKKQFFREEGVVELNWLYKIDGQFLYENYDDESNMFVYTFHNSGNRLTLEYVQGNVEVVYPGTDFWIYERRQK